MKDKARLQLSKWHADGYFVSAVSGIGQDHHRFIKDDIYSTKHFIKIANCDIPHTYQISANSDGDVVIHALCNAISSLSGENILGFAADDLCRSGVTDSRVYLAEALKSLRDRFIITHIAVAIEALEPKLKTYLETIRYSLAQLCELEPEDVGICATTGESLTGMGKGDGIACIVIVSALKCFY